jgi:hypothetical protein
MISCACVLPSKLILLELTFSLVPGPLLLLTSVALKCLLYFLCIKGNKCYLVFRYLTYPHTSLVCSCFFMLPKSNTLLVFALDLMSAYEGEHTIFGFLGFYSKLFIIVFQNMIGNFIFSIENSIKR